MSPIIDIQYRLRELGRIRMGKKGPRGAPVKLDTWRLTSASKELLDIAAANYGGKVKVWKDAPNDGEQFELVTETPSLPIVIPPNDAAFSQWMESWSGGGCQKRCDGQRQVLKDVPCSCPKDISERMEEAQKGKACKPTTRFNVLLPEIPDVGVWRLESHGYNAAVELAAFQQLAEVATQQGRMIRARLRIEHRSVKRDGKTNKFTVPVVEISHTVGDMLQALGADMSDVSISLPAPVEGRSLPGGAPALPAEAPGWDLEEQPETQSSDLYPWLEDLAVRFGEGEVLDAINTLRARGGAPLLESLSQVADAGPDRVAILRVHLEAKAVESESPEFSGGPDAPAPGNVDGGDTDAPTRSDEGEGEASASPDPEASVAGGGDGTTTSEEATPDGSSGPSSRDGKSDPAAEAKEKLETAKQKQANKKRGVAAKQGALAEGASSQARGDDPSVKEAEETVSA